MIARSISWRRLVVAGRTRHYQLVAPTDAASHPLLLALHGGGARPEGFALITGIGTAGPDHGYAVALPAAEGWGWQRDSDPELLAAVIADVDSVLPIDREHVFVLGWSNGGKMALRFGCERSATLRGVAAVGTGYDGDCALQRPLPLLLVHGTSDTFHPYRGGPATDESVRGLQQVGSVRTAELWAERLGCDPPRRRPSEPPVTLLEYPGGRDHTLVLLYLIDGMGHQWPGHTVTIPAAAADTDPTGWPSWLSRLGPGSDALDATSLILEFFDRLL